MAGPAQSDFAVCVEPFVNPIWPIIRKANPLIVFSHIREDRRGKCPAKRIVQIGSKDVAKWLLGEGSNEFWEYITRTAPAGVTYEPLTLGQSPFFAAAVAAYLGFETIGLIGVDLTEDRWPDVTEANEAWGRLVDVVSGMGSRIVNLSPESRLVAVEQGTWEDIRRK
jgi:hypothetical protein